MNDIFYKQLIEDSKVGYAYHKIIFDVDGVPCDYEFIYVNKVFAKVIGLKRSDIEGRKISNILPHLNKSKLDFIHICGDIAINGGEKEVEQFSESLKCFYKVVIRFTEKYYFTTQLGMIISRRCAEDELLNEKILTDAIFNSAPGIIYLYDEQSRLVRWKSITLIEFQNYAERWGKHLECLNMKIMNLSQLDYFMI